MAVNLSPRQFADEHLLHDIDEALAASGMSPVLLQLEVTESMVMRNVARAVRVLDAIQSRGIRLAIDDFGTGYSSMSLMKQFPIDTIKIDRSFVRDLPRDSEDQAIAQAIISMGKALGMTVVAEGVETAEQQAFLRDHRCDEMQGYLFSKPLPPRELAKLAALAARARVAAAPAGSRTAADRSKPPTAKERRSAEMPRAATSLPSTSRRGRRTFAHDQQHRVLVLGAVPMHLLAVMGDEAAGGHRARCRARDRIWDPFRPTRCPAARRCSGRWDGNAGG